MTNPVHQWPDQAIYVNPMGQELAGIRALLMSLAELEPGKAVTIVGYPPVSEIRARGVFKVDRISAPRPVLDGPGKGAIY